MLGSNVSAKMLTWVDQLGFPLLTITNEQFAPTEVTLTINQRYYIESAEETDQSKLWFIPLYVSTDAGEQYYELTEANTVITVKIKDKDS